LDEIRNAEQRRKRMSRVLIDLCEDSSEYDGESPQTASVPSIEISRKRRHREEDSSVDAHPCKKNGGPGRKTATGSAELAFDLELADEVEDVSPHIKRRAVMKKDRSGKNDATGNSAHVLEGVHVTEKDVGSEDGQAMDHHEFHEGFAAAALHQMSSDSKKTRRDYEFASKHPHEVPTSKLPLNESGRQGTFSAWKGRFSELVVYHKINGHCNVPRNYTKLGRWVTSQRTHYRFQLEGKASSMKPSRIQALESLGIEWRVRDGTWEDYLKELADYRKIRGHCSVPHRFSENPKLGRWVSTQRTNYWLHLKGKTSHITPFRIQELESLGFEWKSSSKRGKTRPKKSSPNDDATRVCGTAVEATEPIEQRSLKKIAAVKRFEAIKLASHLIPKNQTGVAMSPSTSSRVESKHRKRVKAGDARFDGNDRHGSPLELAAKTSLYSNREATKSLSPSTDRRPLH
jgi:hypothetical protein